MAAPDGPTRTGRFSVLIGSFIGGSDPEASLNLDCADARAGGDNYSRYCSKRFEPLFADQLSATNQRQRERDFEAIANLVHDEIPVIPLYDFVNIEGIDRRVTGYRRDMLRFPVHPENWDAQ
jgi:ABC-type transport system substrate-binding protein